MRFDVVVFARPDLVSLLPLWPWCFHAPHAARRNQDWLEWLPRSQAGAALSSIHDDYFGCMLPNFTMMATDYATEAARRGTRFVDDDALRVLTIARDNQPHFPHKKDCTELARGFAAVGREGHVPSGLATRLIAQSSPALRHCARCPLDACQRLTFGNPSNGAA